MMNTYYRYACTCTNLLKLQVHVFQVPNWLRNFAMQLQHTLTLGSRFLYSVAKNCCTRNKYGNVCVPIDKKSYHFYISTALFFSPSPDHFILFFISFLTMKTFRLDCLVLKFNEQWRLNLKFPEPWLRTPMELRKCVRIIFFYLQLNITHLLSALLTVRRPKGQKWYNYVLIICGENCLIIQRGKHGRFHL